eukprot:COSAG05_NODE_2255_length_3333_cov_2.791899_3_plen_235_part_00
MAAERARVRVEPGSFACAASCPCCTLPAAPAAACEHPTPDVTGWRSQRVGAVRMVSMQDGVAAYPVEEVPAASSAGVLTLSFGCTLVQSCGQNILCDTSLGDVAPPVPPECRHRDLRELLQAAAGLSPEDIHSVVFSHGHTDHVAGGVRYDGTANELVPAFPNARYLIRQLEHDCCRHDSLPNDSRQLYTRWFAPLQLAGVLEVIPRDKDELVLTSEVSLLPWPGHTPGSQVVR